METESETPEENLERARQRVDQALRSMSIEDIRQLVKEMEDVLANGVRPPSSGRLREDALRASARPRRKRLRN